MSNAFHISPRPYPVQEQPLPRSTVDIGDVKGILSHRRMLILGTAGLLMLAALLYGLLTAPLFSSTAQIIIDPRDLQVVRNDIYPNGISPDGGITQVESQVSVLQSSGVLLRAVEATNLTQDPEFNSPGLLSGLTTWLSGTTGDREETPDLQKAAVKTLDALRRRLAVKRADKVLVIDVTVTSKSADKAALLANAIAEAYLADQAAARSQTASQASDALAARLAELRSQVEKAENAVELYKLQNNMVMASDRLVSDQELTDLNNQLTAAKSRTVTLKAQVDQITRQRESGTLSGATSEAMQSGVITQLRSQEAALEERATNLKSQLGPNHPSMVSVRSQLGNLQQLIARELDRIATSATIDYERALANERDLSAKVNALKDRSLSTSQASVHLRELQRDLDAVRSIYANYLTRAQETREQVSINSTNARIITHAMPAQKKSWPPLSLLLAGALCGGLGLGAGLALVAEYISPTILSAGQIQGALGVPVFGIVPGERRKKRNLKWLYSRKTTEYPSASALGPKTDGVIGLALRRMADAGRWNPNSKMTPSIVLTSQASDDAERMQIVGLLGLHAASKGDRVLLIDADMSKPEASEPGLSDILAGDATLHDAIHFHFGKDIAYMGRGRYKKVLREKEGRYYAQRMLSQARDMFDLVVIDGGPLCENLKAEPLVGLVNGLILVAEKNATPLSDAESVAQAADIMGRPLTGILLVDASIRP